MRVSLHDKAYLQCQQQTAPATEPPVDPSSAKAGFCPLTLARAWVRKGNMFVSLARPSQPLGDQ
jgi:hypothetical protein